MVGLEGSSALSTELSEDVIENREPSSTTFQANWSSFLLYHPLSVSRETFLSLGGGGQVVAGS